MTTVISYRCLKCHELWHESDLHRHHYVCYQENVSPEEILDCFEQIPRRVNEKEKQPI